MQLSWICIFIMFLSSGCGTQDYGDGPETNPSSVKEIGITKNWRELAIENQERPLEITRGNIYDSSRAIQSKVSFEASCPDEAICFRGSYMGSLQLADLAVRFPEVVKVLGSSTDQIYQVKSMSDFIFEVDLFDLKENEGLKVCGPSLSLIASEVSGGGVIDGSASNCDERKNGSHLKVLADQVTEIQLISNGLDGSDGKSGEITWQDRAADGDSNGIRVESSVSYKDLDSCAEFFSCTDSWKDEIDGSDVAERMADASRWMDRHYAWLESKGIKRDVLETHISKAVEAQKEAGALMSGMTNCRIKSKRGVSNQTGIVDSVRLSLSGLEKLNGEDAKFKSEGVNGEDGGDSGLIEIAATFVEIPRVIVKAGQPGKAGKSFSQSPGRGATSEKSSYNLNLSFNGWFECPYDFGKYKNGKWVPDIQPIYKQPLEFKTEEQIGLNQLRQRRTFNSVEGIHSIRGSQAIVGTDGKSIQIEKAKDGVEGKSLEPNIIQTNALNLLEEKSKEFCPSCDLPIAIVEKGEE